MSTRFVEVPTEAIESFLKSKGFEKSRMGQEVVYIRTHDRVPQLKVKVFTSIKVGAHQARPCGKDAIRITAAFEGKSCKYGIYKATRTFRTGSVELVLERMYSRMKEAYQACNEWVKENCKN